MRLFIAINFGEEVKDILCDTMLRLKGHALQGNYTRRDNLHLTLAFLGETDRLESACEAVDQLKAGPFAIRLEGIGVFRRERGDCYWMGVAPNRHLSALQAQLGGELQKRGFALGTREFRPHLTLARGVLMADSFNRHALANSLGSVPVEVGAVSLMRSDRVGRKLIYTELLHQELKRGGN